MLLCQSLDILRVLEEVNMNAVAVHKSERLPT